MSSFPYRASIDKNFSLCDTIFFENGSLKDYYMKKSGDCISICEKSTSPYPVLQVVQPKNKTWYLIGIYHGT